MNSISREKSMAFDMELLCCYTNWSLTNLLFGFIGFIDKVS